MEKKLLILSNATSAESHLNTLVDFKTAIPDNFLDQHKSWSVAVASVGLHLRFKNPIVSQNESLPSLIQINKADLNKAVIRYGSKLDMSNLPIEIFSEHNKIFIDGSKSYTARGLVNQIKMDIFNYARKYPHVWNGVPVSFNESTETIDIGQFMFDGEINEFSDDNGRDNARTYVLIHENFAKQVVFSEIAKSILNRVIIANETYYMFFNSVQLRKQSFYPLATTAKEFMNKKPNLIQITSPNIKKSLSNGTYVNVLKQFSICESDVDQYLQKRFNHLDFFQLNEQCNSTLEVKFCDDELNLLRLRPGFPSYIQFIFKPEIMNTDIIRVSSIPNGLYPSNSLANFNINFPKALDYGHREGAKISLSSITLENEWELLPGLLLQMQLTDLNTNSVKTFSCPKDKTGPRSSTEVCNWFEKQLESILGISVKKNNDRYEITFSKKFILIIGRDLGQILGFPFTDKLSSNTSIHLAATTQRQRGGYKTNFYSTADELNVFKIKIKSSILSYEIAQNSLQKTNDLTVTNFFQKGNIVLSAEKDTTYLVPYATRNIQLFPNLLYVYANCVKPSPINNQYRQLLRIVPLPIDNQDKLVTVEFKQQEFVPLSLSRIELLNFKIVTHDDKFVKPLDGNNIVYMNLLIKYD